MASSQRQSFPTVTQTFLNRVRAQPEKDGFYSKVGAEWKPTTWMEHFEAIRDVSTALTALGIKAGDKTGIISSTRIEWSQADMASLGARAVVVPVYPSNTAEDTSYILNHAEVKIVFVEDAKQLEKVRSHKSEVPGLKKIVVISPTTEASSSSVDDEVFSYETLRKYGRSLLDSGKVAKDQFEKNLMAAKPSDIFTICYTSGTTGVPKGVVLTYDNLASTLEDVDKALGAWVSEEDIILSFLPVSHIFGKIESMAAYHFGWRTYFAESIEKILVNMGEVRPTLLFAVPRIFEKAYNRIKATIDDSSPVKRKLFAWAMAAGRAYYGKVWDGKKPSVAETAAYAAARKLVLGKIYKRFGGRVNFCVAGGAPLPKEIGEFMRIVGVMILEGYGLTETCAPVTVNTPDHMKFGSIGRPLPEVVIKIAEDGEILVKSRKIFKEYYKNPEATRETLDDQGWLHSGDIGLIDEQGYVKITDRKKDLIVTSGGKNVAPQKIENLAKQHKYISQIMVVGDRRNFLSALIVLEKEEVVKFATENQILFSEYAELVKNPKILALIQGIIDKVNSSLASFESVKRFKIVPNEFTVETGEITPSLKVKRKFVYEKYKGDFESMYGGAAPS